MYCCTYLILDLGSISKGRILKHNIIILIMIINRIMLSKNQKWEYTFHLKRVDVFIGLSSFKKPIKRIVFFCANHIFFHRILINVKMLIITCLTVVSLPSWMTARITRSVNVVTTSTCRNAFTGAI